MTISADTVRQMALALRTYAVQGRDSHKSLAFFGNDAREALADLMGVDVRELEPGTESAKKHFTETIYDVLGRL